MEQKEQFNLFEMYLQELQTIVSCEEAENKELTARIRKGDVLAKKRLVEGNLKLALAMTRDYLNKGVQAADLVQEANMALVLTAEEMADEENKDSSRTFEDILRERIKTALEEAVEEQDTERKIGEEMAARVNILQDVSKELAERLGTGAKGRRAGRANEDDSRSDQRNHEGDDGCLKHYRRGRLKDELILDTPWTDRLECGGKNSGKDRHSLK